MSLTALQVIFKSGGFMQGSGIQSIQIVLLLLLLFVAGFTALARKLRTPYPIVLVLAGLALSFVPGIPRATLNPDLIFFVVLPPLLFSAAWLTSWRDFVHNLVSISFLAFGLVGFTVLGVAGTAHLAFPGFDWRLGVVLGAVVATTDAIAATSIAKRVGLPQRVVDVLEGESLLNDATGLLALEFGLAIVVAGQRPTVTSGFLRLAYLTVAGILVGLVIGAIIHWVEHHIDDGPIEITISLMVPYAAYLAAEFIHASGVLAVVACGLYLGRGSAHFFSPGVRIQTNAVWNVFTFILNGFVFVLIGLQLPIVRESIGNYSLASRVLYGGLFSLLVIFLRLLWVFPGATLAYWIRRHLFHQHEPRPPARQIFVTGWTGMRGVIALAAALSIPEHLANGSPFPQRNLIIFLTFSVILVTLVLQGLTLPALIRALGLAGATGPNFEETEARRIMAEAALQQLNKESEGADPDAAALYGDLKEHYRRRLSALPLEGEDQEGSGAEAYAKFLAVSLELLRVERETAVQLRNSGRINDEVLRQLLQELDLSETRYNAA
ncbi:MAG TPA: Na+/H+ antiporter [Blattabacteriaceae bacterium]|nr:Na+/H+ antiporter [Blattabacteriaceae bacterium]